MLHAPERGVRVPRLDLTRADSEPLPFGGRFELPAGSGGEDVVSVGEVEIDGVVEQAGRGYLVRGGVRGTARLRCVRCLVEFPFAFDERFELRLMPLALSPRDDETRLDRAELEVRFYGEPTLDPGELAAEQLTLALPMKPLCNDSCRGLCPRCGADLNQGRCGCPEKTDERWAPLLGFRPHD